MGSLAHLKEQAEGRKSRQKMLDATLELLTSDAISSERMRESAMALVYLEPKILAEIDRIGRSYIGIALRALEKLA